MQVGAAGNLGVSEPRAVWGKDAPAGQRLLLQRANWTNRRKSGATWKARRRGCATRVFGNRLHISGQTWPRGAVKLSVKKNSNLRNLPYVEHLFVIV